MCFFFFFKQKTAYEMRISDWSSDVCCSDLLFLANPNNPTGSYLSESALQRLHKGLPDHVLLVIDAAYAEYVASLDYPEAAALVEASDNVVMLRTFSKIHGLAALSLDRKSTRLNSSHLFATHMPSSA